MNISATLTRQALMVSTRVSSYCTLCALVCVFLCLVSSCSTLDFRQHSNADNWLIICFSSSSLSALLSCVLCRVLTTLLFAPLSHHSILIRPGTNLRRRSVSNRHPTRAMSSCRLLLNAIIFLLEINFAGQNDINGRRKVLSAVSRMFIVLLFSNYTQCNTYISL